MDINNQTVVCFGDSNTYGFDPRSFFGSRYPADSRWPEVLGKLSGWDVHVDAMNGRSIPRHAFPMPKSTDLLIVLLGTNDLLQGASPATAAQRMSRFLELVPLKKDRILLIAPPPMARGEWVTEDLITASRELSEAYQTLAAAMGVRFLDAGCWDIPLCYDGVHFTEEGHRRFARGIWKEYLK